MTIGDVIKKYPESTEVMLGYGLQCVGCSVNPYETIEQGALGHGMNEDTLMELMDDINLAVTKEPDYPLNPDGITLSPRALETLEAIQEADEKEGFGLKVQATEVEGAKEPDYYLDLVEKAEDNEKTLEWQGMKMFITDESLAIMKPSLIDFLRLPDGEEGFKIISMEQEDKTMDKQCENCDPETGCQCGKGAEEKKEGGCACGSGGCC